MATRGRGATPPAATEPPDPSTGRRDRQKGRTRAALLASAARLLATGATPTVAEVADAAEVSRRTACRYFATQEQLLVEAALEGLRPEIEQVIAGNQRLSPDDAPMTAEALGACLDRTVRAVQRNAVANEALLRTVVRLTVGPFPADDEGEARPRRRGVGGPVGRPGPAGGEPGRNDAAAPPAAAVRLSVRATRDHLPRRGVSGAAASPTSVPP